MGIVNRSEIVQTFGLVALYISVFITPAIVNSSLELMASLLLQRSLEFINTW